LINLFVIPAFAKAFAAFDAELPWATQLLIRVSGFSVAYWPHLLVGLGLMVVAIRMYLKTDEGRLLWDTYKLRLPVIGSIINRATLARYARSFAMTFGAGVPVVQTLEVVARAVDNSFVAGGILSMRNGIERGETLTRAATTCGLFAPLVLDIISVGEESGALPQMHQEIAESYEEEVDYDLNRLSDLLQPILIVALGGIVFLLALGVYLPMWDLGKAALGR
jgi:MSHA biogenesis protein MshG